MKITHCVILALISAGCIAVIIAGIGKIRAFLKNEWRDKLKELPVLKTAEDVLLAIRGEPKVYLIENYAFNNGETVRDTEIGALEGEYLDISIIKETYTVNNAMSNNYRNAVWAGEPYADIPGKLKFSDGTLLEAPENAKFYYSLLAGSRLKAEDLQEEKKANYFMARYYPDGLKFDSTKMKKQLKKNLMKFHQEYSSRYCFNFMRMGDTATFVARLGGGKADLNVFEEANLIAVNGGAKDLARYYSLLGKGNTDSQAQILGYVKLGFWILFMWISFIMGIISISALIATIFEKR